MGMPVIKPGTITREDAVGNIIESVAMEEKSLAHILNAESEKLQAVINKPDVTADELLAVNKSIKTAIVTIIGLEGTLKQKIELFADIICQTN